jgi:hypothetical protein
MNAGKNSAKIFPLTIALLIASSLGLAIPSEMAEAKPPDWAPARGYRCRQHNGRFDNQYCYRNTRRRSRNDDRYYDPGEYDRDRYDRRSGGILYNGTVLEVELHGSRRIVLYPGRSSYASLRVIRAERDRRGRVLIPVGSKIQGDFRPRGDEHRFVARRLILTNGRSYSLNASSSDIYGDRRVASRNLSSITIGEATGTILDTVIGDRRDRRDDYLTVIYPGENLELIVRSNLRIR